MSYITTPHPRMYQTVIGMDGCDYEVAIDGDDDSRWVELIKIGDRWHYAIDALSDCFRMELEGCMEAALAREAA